MSDADSTSARPPVDATEVDALRAQIAELVRDNQRLQEQDDVHKLLDVQCGKSIHYSGCVSYAFALL